MVLTHHLQIEEQYFGIRDRDVNISMCGPFVIHDMTEDSTGQVIIVVNWQTGNVFKLISTVSIGQLVAGFLLTFMLFSRGTNFQAWT